jgi:hypothetical protein
MSDGFVNLQAKLAAAQNQRSSCLGALCGGVQCDRFLGNLPKLFG